MSSLQTAEEISAKGATAPRVSVPSMEARIVEKHFFTVGEALDAMVRHRVMTATEPVDVALTADDSPLHLLTLCVLVLDNGWVMTGKSAPASPENFDPEKGQMFAYEDAIRQLWPLEGYLLRERLWYAENLRQLAKSVGAEGAH